MKLRVESLMVGGPVPFRGEEMSAIAKHPVGGPVMITHLGLKGDAQADLVHHGGTDMAVHLYPADHISFWRGELGDHSLFADPGAFGSNIETSGITEDHVLIGDRFRIGTALLEVSQPRKPCWKIEHRFGEKGMVAAITRTGRCGWYYRVVEEGVAEAGDKLERTDRGHDGWSIKRVFLSVYGKGSEDNAEDLRAIMQLQKLSEDCRAKALKRIG